MDPYLSERLAEQQAYYCARAPEYDDWWLRRGRYDRGALFLDQWQREVAEAEAALDAFAPRGEVLELAAGTGNWTRHLARHADRLTAVDGSGETLAINRSKLPADAAVAFVEADLFDWQPPRRYDVVFFGFWLTHVPDPLLDRFWSLVEGAVADGGRVFLVDNAHPEVGVGAPGGPLDVHYADGDTFRDGVDTASAVADRTLADGRSFTIVKRFWHAADLAADLARRGWDGRVWTTDHFFLLAEGSRR